MFWAEVLGRFLPRLCLLCESPCGCAALCQPCLLFLPGALRPRCHVCARPWQVSTSCPNCRIAPPAYDATLAAADYVAPLDRALTALKFSGQIGLAGGLGSLLAGAWATAGLQSATRAPGASRACGPEAEPLGSGPDQPNLGVLDFLVPIPLSRSRLAQRGFNQAHLIAASMLKRLHQMPLPPPEPLLPVLRPALLTRHRETQAQSLLQWKARQANLDHGFVASGRLEGLRIGVIDDVMTTGATLQAAALALKAAGAARVVNLVVARTA